MQSVFLRLPSIVSVASGKEDASSLLLILLSIFSFLCSLRSLLVSLIHCDWKVKIIKNSNFVFSCGVVSHSSWTVIQIFLLGFFGLLQMQLWRKKSVFSSNLYLQLFYYLQILLLFLWSFIQKNVLLWFFDQYLSSFFLLPVFKFWNSLKYWKQG